MSGQVAAIVPAAGSSKRMGLGDKKQFLKLDGLPVVRHTVERIRASSLVGLITVAVAPADEDRVRLCLEGIPGVQLVHGGVSRQESVFRALSSLPARYAWVLVHDAARPRVKPDLISRVILAARETGAAIAAVPVDDTVKIVCRNTIRETLDRNVVFLAQTPQVFRRDLLERGHRKAQSEDWQATDDADLVQRLGCEVRVVKGERRNSKLTHPEDIEIRGEMAPVVGFGYDVHPFQEGRPLYLGGILIEGETGLAGHSDADVVLHAVIDALLGGAGLGDIGEHFPPGDPQFHNVRSTCLLGRTLDMVRLHGYYPVKLDITVVTERPRLQPYKEAMRSLIAEMLSVTRARVNVKATTEEGMGFTGRGEGIKTYCVATLTEGGHEYADDCPRGGSSSSGFERSM